ncbi:3-hydroxyacyl-CoA dehydrogenase NAD-binding domain-containing protein [Psychrobacillus sp. NEAU-3TGS]|uniref:3-hydroxyacyl-CoA dehydrogenase family protein n=1 Tax=Psychrobacillus sp. NEAU-3TGS TaxID=2995412 RepID=UPI002499301E|nr:3-hydroxyacyl-CoA dehydrogenase NAD-binding domain-containing protein [Psychrobacillus sp. NEAU-3TGS]MDI2588465.1 3-hydroxyacyl-CoA dehydrogenase NAD-binding domain-containing protein [Psychrobacillus sp. NEAU-3TGS]
MDKNKVLKVACIGTGVIGSSWATNFALKGYPVNVYDVKEELFELAKKRINESLEYLAKNEVIKYEEIPEITARIYFFTSIEEAVTDVQFIQESGPENYEIKRSILAQIEKYAPADAIYSSSTSGLLITEIAKFALHPERCVGGHPYNPPHLIPLVEITKGEKTAEEFVQRAKEFYLAVGKEPVVLQKEALGFIANRLQQGLFREAANLVMNGVCTVEDVDKATTFGPGIRWGIMGPALIFDLGGGEGGIKDTFDHMGPSINLWLKDMADFKEYPEGFSDFIQQGVDEELKNRPAELGNNRESLRQYRDDMLIGLLKLHKKL